MRTSIRIVAVAVALACPPSARAQEPARTFEQLGLTVGTGDLVTLSTETGATVRGKILEVRADQLVIDLGGRASAWPAGDIREVRRRTGDPVLNGAIIGAAVGGGLTSLLYLDNECRGDPACATAVIVYAALGAAVGAGVDALIRANPVVYRRSGGRVSWSVAPAFSVEVRSAGIQLSIGY